MFLFKDQFKSVGIDIDPDMPIPAMVYGLKARVRCPYDKVMQDRKISARVSGRRISQPISAAEYEWLRSWGQEAAESVKISAGKS